MRIVVFGANGATGRLLSGQALAAGHHVVAVTRRPAEFPVTHERLRVAEADVHDAQAVGRAVEETENVVLSTLGVPFTRKPVNVYGDGVRNIAAAMSRHGVKRLVVVSLSATEPHHHADGGFVMNRVLQPLVTATIGKTTYATCAAWRNWCAAAIWSGRSCARRACSTRPACRATSFTRTGAGHLHEPRGSRREPAGAGDPDPVRA